MSDDVHTVDDEILAECLASLHARKALGEKADPEDYRERLGAAYPAFMELVLAESLLDGDFQPEVEVLPRPLGPYTLLERLGSGAHGVVYKALHRDLGRHAAVKVLFSIHDRVYRERFRRDARACARIRHDHIVEVYDTGEFEGQLYYAMAPLEGGNLHDAIRAGRVPPHEELARQFAGVCDALALLHAEGIYHRDIKPANLLFDAQGRLVLIDFGIAKSLEAEGLTGSADILGTPAFMSPEQLLGGQADLDGRTDVYGLGASLYEALAGRPPFRAATLDQLITMLTSTPAVPPSSHARGVPEALDRIVLTCLEKDPADRFPDVQALAADLRRFADGEPVEARPVAAWRLRARRMARRPWPWLGALAALALIVGLWVTRPATPTMATLEVHSLLGAAVSVNEGSFHATPHTEEVEPGAVLLVLRKRGYLDYRFTTQLAAGERAPIHVPSLTPADTGDPAVLRETAAARGWSDELGTRAKEGIGRTRAGLGEGVAVLHPRGRIRPHDLRRFHVELGVDAVATGPLELRRGAEVLWRAPEPQDYVHRGAIPASVGERLQPGDELSFGFHEAAGGARVARLVVVADPAADDLARLEVGLDELAPPAPADVRAYFRAQALARHDLDTAALDVLLDLPPAARRTTALVGLEAALLRALAAPEGETLFKTTRYAELGALQEELQAR